jgi:mannose-1-phosphate guanylyltransferase
MPAEKLATHAVILAGGRGTRFWPRSRTRTPKQLLNIIGDTTMLEQTVARLFPLVPADRIWTVTNSEQAAAVREQLPAAARKRVLIEPVGVNTAAAIGLAAVHIRHAAKGDALMAALPSDHFIADAEKYRRIVRAALDTAREPGRLVVLGIPPTRPDTGFGYIERMSGVGDDALHSLGFPVFPVRRFTEKPKLELAQQYLASGNYHWNAGMFFWRVSTFLENLKRFLPKTHAALESLCETIGKKTYVRRLRAVYPKLENISVDYAILEPATRGNPPPNAGAANADVRLQPGQRQSSSPNSAPTSSADVFVIPAEVGWSDVGSWAAVYELLAASTSAVTGLPSPPSDPSSGNIFVTPGTAIDAHGNLISVSGKFTAVVGTRDLVVVETPDALLIVPRDRAQDVAALVKHLDQQKLKKLL